MTMEQWAAMLLGDEAYGSNEGYFDLKEQVGMTFGPQWRQKNGLQVGEREPLFICSVSDGFSAHRRSP